jgi:Iron-dependent Transcriptional regulator
MRLMRTSYYAVISLVYVARHSGKAVRHLRHRHSEWAAGTDDAQRTPSARARRPVALGERGPSGGYRLARPAKDITLLNIIEAVDGPVTAVSDARDDVGALERRRQGIYDQVAADVRPVLCTGDHRETGGEAVDCRHRSN